MVICTHHCSNAQISKGEKGSAALFLFGWLRAWIGRLLAALELLQQDLPWLRLLDFEL